MRSDLREFYQPTEEETKELWSSGIFAFDTSALLTLYRTPIESRNQMFQVLEQISNRLWLPYHASLEFQRRRIGVIKERKSQFDKYVGQINDISGKLKSGFDEFDVDRHGVIIDKDNILKSLDSATSLLREAILDISRKYEDISHEDPVRDRLDKLFADKVGKAPKDNADLHELISDADERFENKIPPGYKDSDKDKDPNGSFFWHRGLKYTRKFGDLIIWKQILSNCSENGIKKIVFVTDDKKEDWWWIEHGKTLGPNTSLSAEILNSGVDIFWMYSFSGLLHHANKYLKAGISAQVFRDVREAAAAKAESSQISSEVNKGINFEVLTRKLRDSRRMSSYMDAVRLWAIEKFGNAILSDSYPDIIAGNDDNIGIQVIYGKPASSSKLIVRQIFRAKNLLELEDFQKVYLVFFGELSINFISFREAKKIAKSMSDFKDSDALENIFAIFCNFDDSGKFNIYFEMSFYT